MPQVIDPDRVRVPAGHRWFLDEVCKGDRLRYLMHRRLLQVTLHRPSTALAPLLPKQPVMSGRLDHPSWRAACRSEGFVLNGVHSLDGPPEAPTWFLTGQHDGSLYVAVRCEDPSGVAVMPLRRDVLFGGGNLQYLHYFTDYVSIFIDPTHGHSSFWEFIASPSGGKLTARSEYTWVLFPVNPIASRLGCEEQGPEVTSRWDLQVRCDKDRRGWTATFRIPLDFFGQPLGPVVGFNVARLKHSMPPEQSVWSDVGWFGENVRVPLRTGDLYLTDSPFTVERLWFGPTHAAAEVHNHSGKEVSSRWVLGREDRSRRRVALPPGRSTVSVPIHGGLRLMAYAGRPERLVFDGSYPCASFTDGPKLGPAGTAPPSKHARNYNGKKMAWLASHLPRLVRVNTADGAPSDFCLADTAGRVLFDMMRPGTMRKMARLIERLFDDPEDRLAAAGILLRQPDIMVYEDLERFGDYTGTPLTVMRVGSGLCGAFGTAIKGVVEALRPPGGGRYRAYRCGVYQKKVEAGKISFPLSHTLVMVLCPDGRQIMLDDGSVYYTRRHKRLVGPDDVEELAAGFTWRHERGPLLVIDSGSVAWPAGAPER